MEADQRSILQSSEGSVTLTCQSCDLTTTQAPGTRRRTVCPHCGNFYHDRSGLTPSSSRATNIRPRRSHSQNNGVKTYKPHSSSAGHLPVLDSQQESKKSSTGNGIGKSIANFFKNIGHRDEASSADRSRSSRQGFDAGTQLPRIMPDASTLTNDANPSPQPPPGGATPNDESPMLIDQHEAQLENQRRTELLSKKIDDLKADIVAAQQSLDWKPILDYYSVVFESFTYLNKAFKLCADKEYKTTETSGIDFPHVYSVYGLLSTLPQDVHKAVLRSVINCLMKDKRVYTKDDLRAYIILLLNPQFRSIPTYMIFAHLIRQMASMSDHNHHFLVHWFKQIDAPRFRELLSKLHKFVTTRLFPSKPDDLPPMSKCAWWIPSATKVLALLNAANNLCEPPLVSYMEFYNSSLDHMDLLAEYYAWQNPQALGQVPQFSFCQYPFILSILAKRSILQRDSEQQMVLMARRSLVNTVQQRQMPDIGMLFLNLRVRRSHLVSDSLNEIALKQLDLKKKLKVTFTGEPGLDMGGLTKEWFLLLIRQIFQPEYGMFTYDKKARVYWFSTTPCENYQEFNLVGVLMGLAVYNSIILDIRFPPVCYRKLLSPAVVPYNLPKATVGVAKVSLRDLIHPMPDLAHGLQELLNYEGDVEQDFGLTFQITYNELGSAVTYALKPDGENIPVTNSNRQEYIQLYVDYLLNGAIYRQFQAFYHGFHSVCASNALIMLRSEEVELLVCGNPSLDMRQLQRVTVYDGYLPDDEPIRNFWQIVLEMSAELQKQVLLFTTGSDRIPVGGMSEMQFKITRVDNVNMLPMSHTCFNQLVLPAYRSRKLLKQKLLIALQNAEGFGLE